MVWGLRFRDFGIYQSMYLPEGSLIFRDYGMLIRLLGFNVCIESNKEGNTHRGRGPPSEPRGRSSPPPSLGVLGSGFRVAFFSSIFGV